MAQTIEFKDIQFGDKVTFKKVSGRGRNGIEYKEVTGKVVMKGPYGWVLNTGGKHGTPGIANESNFVKATRPN